MIKTLRANFGERSYDLLYGSGLLKDVGRYIPNLKKETRVIILTNPRLKELFEDQITESLSGNTLIWHLISDGESYKNLATVSEIYSALALNKIDKGSIVIAMGGGVLQDIATYACATYRRGVPLVQIPTTVLSQADIGIGGCAVDHKFGKSLIGTFYQPILVINDTDVLQSLPIEQFINGYAEIICKVVCLGGDRLDLIPNDLPRLRDSDELLADYVSLSARYKKETIERDEIGTKGTRIFLDYGHTVTYALETLMDYKMMHGFALGIGMHIATTISFLKGFLRQDQVKYLKNLIEAAGLPTQLPVEVDCDKLIEQMSYDQKTKNGEIRFVLLKDFGQPFLSDPLTREEIKEAIQST